MILALLSIMMPSLGSRHASSEIKFAKHVIDTRFVSEGVAVADIDRDGRIDIVAGNVWYRAPKWTPNEIAPFVAVDPKSAYSNCFHNWCTDLNRDGWLDQILVGMPGAKAIWRENPKGAKVPWPEHPLWRSAGNESPHYEDLFRNGKRVLVMAYDDAHLAWFEPASDPNAEWICHNVSELRGAGSQRYSHGLGVGDLDADGRNEIITTSGYYVMPKDPRSGPWTFVKADLGPDCAHMLVLGRDVLTTSAHARGVWSFHPAGGGGYERTVIEEKISQTHAAVIAPLGSKTNLITGKRKWAHPPGVDVGTDEPSLLVRYELTSIGESQLWVPYVIDDASGVGTQFVVQDVTRDGLEDIVASNKNGVFLFEQRHSN